MGKLPRISAKVSLISEKAVRCALVGIVAVMTVIIILQVFLRYLFLFSLSWSEEVARYLMIWASFLGASLAVKYGLHIGVEYVINRFPQGLKRAITLVAKASILFFLLLFTIGGLQVAWALRDQDSPALLFSMFYAYLSVPVGGVFMIIQLWNSIVEDWAK
jgi:TRAP-type C4-dicarboxylate transport system permease small subunit